MKLEELKKLLDIDHTCEDPDQEWVPVKCALIKEAIRLAGAYKQASQNIWKRHGLVFTWSDEELDSEAERLMETPK